MHELGIAKSLLDSAIQEARAQGAESIREISIAASGVPDEEVESLKMYMNILSRNTMAENSSLVVNRVSSDKRGFYVADIAVD